MRRLLEKYPKIMKKNNFSYEEEEEDVSEMKAMILPTMPSIPKKNISGQQKHIDVEKKESKQGKKLNMG